MARCENEKRIAELKKKIEEVTQRLPRHSVPAAMMIELEELEEELERLEADCRGESEGAG